MARRKRSVWAMSSFRPLHLSSDPDLPALPIKKLPKKIGKEWEKEGRRRRGRRAYVWSSTSGPLTGCRDNAKHAMAFNCERVERAPSLSLSHTAPPFPGMQSPLQSESFIAHSSLAFSYHGDSRVYTLIIRVCGYLLLH
jgi:hypothetical protein